MEAFVPVNPEKLYLHPSDHYALELKLAFKFSLKGSCNHQSALAIILPNQFSQLVQSIREKYDRTYERWPPHINLFYPFYKEIDLENCAGEIFNCLSSFEPFEANLIKLNSFATNKRLQGLTDFFFFAKVRL